MSERAHVEASLRRIEELVAGLNGVTDPLARQHARTLMETVLDLHGLALARMTALAAQADIDLAGRFAADTTVSAVLLMHGLHPVPLEERVREALDEVRSQLRPRGARIGPVDVAAGMVRLTVEVGGLGSGTRAALREEIEAALLAVAPDLEAIQVSFADAPMLARNASETAGAGAC